MSSELPPRADVIVIGAGPTGCSAAISLAQLGVDVVILEQERFPRSAVGSSLPPKADALLALLGVLRATQRADFVRMSGMTMSSGSDVRRLDFDSGAQALGYQLERDHFDALLLARARAVGCRVFEGCEVVQSVGDPAGTVEGVRVRSAETISDVLGRLVIDATGAVGLLRSLNRSRESSNGLPSSSNGGAGPSNGLRGSAKGLSLPSCPPTTVLAGAWKPASPEEDETLTNTLVDLLPEGWVSSVIQRGPVRTVHVGVDASAVAGRSLSHRLEVYQSMLSASVLVGPLVRKARLRGPVTVIDATPRSAGCFVGDGFLLAGDAGFVTEPLLAEGVYKALHTGILAAAVANTVLNRPKDAQMALAYYDSTQRSLFEGYSKLAQRLYNSPGVEGDFWRARRLSEASSLPESPTTEDVARTRDRFQEILRRSDPSKLHVQLRDVGSIGYRPSPRGGFITMAPYFAVRGEAFEASDLDLLRFTRLLDGRTLEDVFKGYARATESEDSRQNRAAQTGALARLFDLDALNLKEDDR